MMKKDYINGLLGILLSFIIIFLILFFTRTKVNTVVVDTLMVGKEARLEYEEQKGNLIWESDNEDVAIVKFGIVTGLEKGEATVTLSVNG